MSTISDRLLKAMRDLHRSWMEVTPKNAGINKSQYFTLRGIKVFMDEHPGSKGATVKDLAKNSSRSLFIVIVFKEEQQVLPQYLPLEQRQQVCQQAGRS